MKITRRFTEAGKDVFSSVKWTKRSSKISNLDGSVVFEMHDAEVPESWSQLATDIIVSKYFRKAGIPQTDEDGQSLKDDKGKIITGPEKSARQVIHRLAGCWRHWGEKHGYFDTQEDAQAFCDELCYMLLHQMAAPNSPQWFNTGLNWSYGLTGPAQGHWYTDPATGETRQTEDAYSRPQPHACFIQSLEDNLANPGGIMDLWVREARLFKYGSGTGTNFSSLRGEDEPLSGGGRSSGLMSWLRIGDRAAGAIKSGGTTRRAAKMVCLDVDHPDVEKFISWKVREELKVAAMVKGIQHLTPVQKRTAERLGLKLDYDFNGESYQTVSGQNSNNSVRIANDFIQCIDEDGQWDLIRRTDGKLAKSVRARDLWDQIGRAAWSCADPGVQFDTTINQWHTCPQGGRINASNPCSEYMFLDDTACNLASLNLLKFYDAATRRFDIDGFEHATMIWTIVLEISVVMASYPSKEIARLSHEYRTLGLGYANLGAMLMQAGIPYDSDKARAICGTITAILTGRSYATSAQMAAKLGPFSGFFRNREAMLHVIRNHRRAAYSVPQDSQQAAKHDLGEYEDLEIPPVPIDASLLEETQAETGLVDCDQLLRHARQAWDEALYLGEQHGFRNAQTTVIAPTGTIGLLMDCDTTGVEPDFALVKFKKLAGGGYFKIANQSLRPALEVLDYNEQQIRDILTYVLGTLSFDVVMPSDGVQESDPKKTLAQFLKDKGFNDDDLRKASDELPAVFELQYAFNVWTLGQETIDRLELTKQAQEADFNLLKAIGLSSRQIKELNRVICGAQTIEQAPHFKDEHLPVFDCANTCGPMGKRFILVEGHIRMMSAAQPFICGAISKTINLPNSADVEDFKSAYRLSWELGLKANALYRDGCKLSQPLNTSSTDVELEIEDEESCQAGKEEVVTEVAELGDCVAAALAENDLHDDGAREDYMGKVTVEKIVERIVERPMRRRLPDTRQSITHKFNVSGHEGYLTVGLYEDKQPGELFITMAKEGSTIGGLMDSLGTAISVALQYGVPVESLVTKFTHQRFEPAGMTHNPDIPFAKSLVDYIFRWMGMEFISGYKLANAPQRHRAGPPDQANAASIAGDGDASTEASVVSADPPATEPSGQSVHGDGNGRGNGKRSAGHDVVPGRTSSVAMDLTVDDHRRNLAVATSASSVMKEMQLDAPACDVCGTITVRNGNCYKCLNCGNSMGCS